MREHHQNARAIAARFVAERQRAERAGCAASWRAAGETFAVAMAAEMRTAGISLEIHFAETVPELSAAVQAASVRLESNEAFNVLGLLSDSPGVVVVVPSLNCEDELRRAVQRAKMEVRQ